MRTLFLLLIIHVITTIGCNILPRLFNETRTLPKYTLDLDLPVKERYKDLLTANKDKVKLYAKATSKAPLAYLVSKIGRMLKNRRSQDAEWLEYIQAVSEYCEISLDQAIMLSVTYDMACTSVIIQDESGKVFMGRNLDFGTYFVIAHLMFEVDYIRNGNLVYKGIELIGFRGAINAVKPGKFSLSLNLRTGTYRMANLLRVYEGYPTPNYYMMKVLEQAESYKEAVEMLSTTPLSAPVYYTISGINQNEGALITRDYDKLHSIDTLDVANGRWFIAICNTDIDQEESQDDYRRVPAEEHIREVGRQNINYENLFSNVLSQYPNNNYITVYSTVQSAEGYFNTTLWLP